MLDIHFNQAGSTGEKFAVASSTGSISIFNLEPGTRNPVAQINPLSTVQVFPKEILVTCLSWLNYPFSSIGVSSSNGEVKILNFDKDLTMLHDSVSLTTHQGYTAWTVAFSMDQDSRSRSPVQAIYSGGDDERLRIAAFSWDEGRLVCEANYDDGPGRANGLRGHNAGVTAILPLPLPTKVGEDILVTGSYDDHVRVYAMYDYRPGEADTRPKVLAELNLGGGVWRLTFLRDYSIKPISPKGTGVAAALADRVKAYGPSEKFFEHSFRILASCMQAGARIIEVKGSLHGEWTIEVLAELKFNAPDILNYAGDVQPPCPSPNLNSRLDEQNVVCVSANFYEKQICVWAFRNAKMPEKTRGL